MKLFKRIIGFILGCIFLIAVNFTAYWNVDFTIEMADRFGYTDLQYILLGISVYILTMVFLTQAWNLIQKACPRHINCLWACQAGVMLFMSPKSLG